MPDETTVAEIGSNEWPEDCQILLSKFMHFDSRLRAFICLAAFWQISCTWVSKFSFESISIPSSLTDREGFIVTFPTAKFIVSGFFIPSTIAWNLSGFADVCSFQWTKTACLLCLSQDLFWETQHPLLPCSVYCRLHSHTGHIHGRSRIYRSWIYWRGVAQDGSLGYHLRYATPFTADLSDFHFLNILSVSILPFIIVN